MLELRERKGVSARAVEFCILTAARSGEVRGATWDEIDLGTKTWTIPAARMKVKKSGDHRVPLSDAAVTCLKAMEPVNPGFFVFSGAKLNKLHETLTTVLGHMKRDDITLHGFRSTFRDWAAEKTHHAGEVVEMALAHNIKSKVEAAYRRGDLLEKRRDLMNDWARYCNVSNETAKVLQLRERSK